MQTDEITDAAVPIAWIQKSIFGGKSEPAGRLGLHVTRADENGRRPEFIGHLRVVKPGIILKTGVLRASLVDINPPRHSILVVARPQKLCAADEPQVVDASHAVRRGAWC